MSMLRKKHIRKLATMLALMFVFSSTVAYGQTFKDVSSSHWAKDYIEKVNKVGIVEGDDKGNFEPEKNIVNVQAVVMVARMMGIDSMKTSQARQTYQSILNQVGVQSWYQNGVAVALTAGIITEEELRGFYTNGNEKVASRIEIVRYITKAMGLADEAKKTTIFSLPFNDVENLNVEDKQFIAMLVKHGVVGGDDKGNFNPHSNIKRSEMAKMLAVAYDYMKENLLFNVLPSTKPSPNVKTMEVQGKITNVQQSGSEFYITIKDRTGNIGVYRTNSDSDVRLNGQKIAYNALIIGQDIDAIIQEDTRTVLALKTEGINEEYKGIVKSVVNIVPESLTIEYYPAINSTRTERITFSIDSNTDIILDGKYAYLRDIKEGDTVTVKVRNSRPVEVNAERKDKEIEGHIKDINLSSKPSLTVTVENNKDLTYEIDSKATVYRKNRKVDLKDLKKGDKVELKLEYNIIKDIDATVVKSSVKGVIEAITLSRYPELKVKNTDGDTVTHSVASDVYIVIGNKKGTINDLKYGDYVKLEIEGSEIIGIDVIDSEQDDIRRGRVEYISKRSGFIEFIEVDRNTGEERLVTVYVTDKTTYIDEDGRLTTFNYIVVGDYISVMGESDGRVYTANVIIVK